MSAEQARFDQACQARDFTLAAEIARALDHRADHLGIILTRQSELFWRSENDHPIARLIMDRLQVDGGTDSEGDYYGGDNALSKDNFASLFKVLANAMEPISTGSTRMRLANNLVKRVDLRCDLINEMPRWFKDATKTSGGQTETIFDTFLGRFNQPYAMQSLSKEFTRPDGESDEAIYEFVKTCHVHGLITDKAIAAAAASDDGTVANRTIEIAGVDPVLSWRSADGSSILHQAIWDQKSTVVIERLLALGADPRATTDKFDNVLHPAVFIKSKNLPLILQVTDWTASELTAALEQLHSPDDRTQEIEAMLHASIAIASMRQIRRGVTP